MPHAVTELIILEDPDASGKDGAIKRIVQHLSPRETHLVGLGETSDRDRTSWYFQRYVPYAQVLGAPAPNGQRWPRHERHE